MIRVTESNLEELSKRVEILEVLDEGVKILTTKNGVVMRESVAKWDDIVLFGEDMSITLSRGVDFAVQGDEIAEAAMTKATSQILGDALEQTITEKKTKKPRAKKTKKVE
ncbi:MAG: hypothetical protein EOM67_15050 [Spirochaetia bacterium]|nr:hypothetical protein [Spirochaetia bacterium]